jgi:hypothetical protein
MLKNICGLTLMWLGIVGVAITLFANRVAPLDMADWAWKLVAPWQDWTPEFWDWFAGRLGLALPSWLVPPLNIAWLFLFTAIGVRIREHDSRAGTVLNYPFARLFGGMVAVFAIGYILLAGQSQPTAAGEAAGNAPLLIFLTTAAVSFSPVIVGGGDLIKRLWFMLGGLGILLALNELTKLGVEITAPKAPN